MELSPCVEIENKIERYFYNSLIYQTFVEENTIQIVPFNPSLLNVFLQLYTSVE